MIVQFTHPYCLIQVLVGDGFQLFVFRLTVMLSQEFSFDFLGKDGGGTSLLFCCSFR